MANANTEHSKKLRARTAAEHLRRKKAAGEVAQMTLLAKTEVMDDFKALLASFGGSRAEAMAALNALHADRIAEWRATKD